MWLTRIRDTVTSTARGSGRHVSRRSLRVRLDAWAESSARVASPRGGHSARRASRPSPRERPRRFLRGPHLHRLRRVSLDRTRHVHSRRGHVRGDDATPRREHARHRPPRASLVSHLEHPPRRARRRGEARARRLPSSPPSLRGRRRPRRRRDHVHELLSRVPPRIPQPFFLRRRAVPHRPSRRTRVRDGGLPPLDPFPRGSTPTSRRARARPRHRPHAQRRRRRPRPMGGGVGRPEGVTRGRYNIRNARRRTRTRGTVRGPCARAAKASPLARRWSTSPARPRRTRTANFSSCTRRDTRPAASVCFARHSARCSPGTTCAVAGRVGRRMGTRGRRD